MHSMSLHPTKLTADFSLSHRILLYAFALQLLAQTLCPFVKQTNKQAVHLRFRSATAVPHLMPRPQLNSDVSQSVLRKASRTTSGSDSYFAASSLLGMDGSNDDGDGGAGSRYLLKPRGFALPPIDVQLFVARGHVHSRVVATNLYGLYSMADVDSPEEVKLTSIEVCERLLQVLLSM